MFFLPQQTAKGLQQTKYLKTTVVISNKSPVLKSILNLTHMYNKLGDKICG